MCQQFLKIKSNSPYGSKYGFVPCGHCAECRKSYQSQWFFRLAAELDSCRKKNWNIGFFTLTYNDKHLPWAHFDGGKDSIMCFRRQDVRRLILRLRKQYFQEFGIKELVYLIASEFGEHTSRPHYHGIISFPPELSAKRVLSDIKRYWSDEFFDSLGFVFPSFEDAADDLFLCKSAFGAAQYASKYCCKDIAYQRYISKCDIALTSTDAKDLTTFHIQSRSLGLSCLRGLSDEEKYDLYVNGLQLVGSSRALSIPLYIRNKLFFDPFYIVDEKGNRQVLRVCTSFMRKYAPEIYEKKVKFYQGFFDKFVQRDFWQSLHLDSLKIDRAVDAAEAALHWFGTTEWMSQYYVSYYGVPLEKRRDSLVDTWLNRYAFYCFDKPKRVDYSTEDRILTYLYSFVQFQNKEIAYEKMVNIDDVLDFHHNFKSSIIGS